MKVIMCTLKLLQLVNLVNSFVYRKTKIRSPFCFACTFTINQVPKHIMAQSIRRIVPLSWGTGPRLFEIFLEPTCPFSVRAFNKLDELLKQAGEDQITIKIYLQSQPWHMYSGVIVRSILAASTLEGGKETAKKVFAAVASHREEFEFTDHCSGPNMNTTPNEILSRIELYSGVSLKDAFEKPELQQDIKFHCKYARQNGIHVSPTFLVDGLVENRMSSGDEVSHWVDILLH